MRFMRYMEYAQNGLKIELFPSILVSLATFAVSSVSWPCLSFLGFRVVAFGAFVEGLALNVAFVGEVGFSLVLLWPFGEPVGLDLGAEYSSSS
jgi:hypothetical protein